MPRQAPHVAAAGAAAALQLRATPHGSALLLPPALASFAPMPGQPLPADVRQRMEDALGASFADVRVHTGTAAQTLGATAFTHGSNIHFAPGQYDPHSPRGRQLLAHELTHVVQQRAGRVANPFGDGTAVVFSALLEAEAERFAREVNAVAIQPLMLHAEQYVLRNNLKFKVTTATVKAYIANKANGEIHRRGLWNAWHRRGAKKTQTQKTRIPFPADLKKVALPSEPSYNFLDWDSDDDKATDVPGTIAKAKTVTLVRGDGEEGRHVQRVVRDQADLRARDGGRPEASDAGHRKGEKGKAGKAGDQAEVRSRRDLTAYPSASAAAAFFAFFASTSRRE
ncbi:MAG: DUF4157 domain-containing protein [Acidobacteria bacterium]|nr:DUF4157 domain-containing protein [Acidobacteriota bacterium]MBV9478870.1 DUF4157 domain-containing protein [Acidobacteriota bacterium]